MRTILFLPFIFILSCATPALPTASTSSESGFLITAYDPRGKIENTYFVKEYDVGIDDVSFAVDNKTKTVGGSFKIEKISKK
jgi:hypothetical protein